MGTYPRLRRAAKWGGLGLAGVCVALWCVSTRWTVDYGASNDRGTRLAQGSVWFTSKGFHAQPPAATATSARKLLLVREFAPEPPPAPPARGRTLRFLRRDTSGVAWSGGGMQWTYQRLVVTACGVTGSSTWETAVIPLWMPAALGLAVGVPPWLLDRRARRHLLAGHCPRCVYDRSTLPAAAPCPECGAGRR